MRNRLALHFGSISFALAWGWICLANEGGLPSLGGALAFAALSALVGWLSFSEAGRAWTALRTIGWTPVVALIVAGGLSAIFSPHEIAEIGAFSVIGSLFLLPLYVPIAMLTPRT
jgi:hypothetical protein